MIFPLHFSYWRIVLLIEKWLAMKHVYCVSMQMIRVDGWTLTCFRSWLVVASSNKAGQSQEYDDLHGNCERVALKSPGPLSFIWLMTSQRRSRPPCSVEEDCLNSRLPPATLSNGPLMRELSAFCGTVGSRMWWKNVRVSQLDHVTGL